jgi:ATP-dependent Lon protease
MNYIDILRVNPHLKKCNINNICDRFLKKTNGNAFVVFNNVQQAYEIHTMEAYYLSGDSYNTTIFLENLNENTIIECQVQDFSKNLDDILSEREANENWREHWGNNKRRYELDQQLKTIERVMGTKQ